MEEYNMAILPHKKYYDLKSWEKKEMEKRANKLEIELF